MSTFSFNAIDRGDSCWGFALARHVATNNRHVAVVLELSWNNARRKRLEQLNCWAECLMLTGDLQRRFYQVGLVVGRYMPSTESDQDGVCQLTAKQTEVLGNY